MKSLRELQDFHEVHGHCAVERLRAPSDDLVRWCEAQQRRALTQTPTPAPALDLKLIRCEAQRGARRKGMLSDERTDYLTAIGFEWEGAGK